MGEPVDHDERSWQADKRDFVADRRDEIATVRDAEADSREVEADERERLGDAREADLEEWERQRGHPGRDLGLPGDDTAERASGARAVAPRARKEARAERAKRAAARAGAAAARDDADRRRAATTPTTRLAMAFAKVAQYLSSSENSEELLDRVVETAVATVAGCDMASVTVRDGEHLRTAATTHEAAIEADLAQYESKEGPCLDAIDEPVVDVPSFPDDRWPCLGSQMERAGVRSVVSYRLAPAAGGNASISGSLNSYAGTPAVFDDEAREIGLVLAAHASIAVAAFRRCEAAEQLACQLHEALSSRDVIVLAKGILMERLGLTPDDAFDSLRRASQQLNRRLRDVAQGVIESTEAAALPSG